MEMHRTMTSFMRIRLLKWLLKVSQKMLQKEEMLLGYESVTLNMSMLWSILALLQRSELSQMVKKENSNSVFVNNYPAGYPAGYPAEYPAQARPLVLSEAVCACIIGDCASLHCKQIL